MRPNNVEIIRDTWGIPHVYADDEAALFYGLGYAMAEDRLLQMTLKRREAVGSLAEVLGAGENGKIVESDKLSRYLDVAGAAEREILVMGKDDRRNLEAFADGMNAYMEANWESHSPLFAKYGGKPQPWKAQDSLAIWVRLQAAFSLHWMSEVQAKREFEKNPEAYKTTNLSQSHAPQVDDAAAIVTEEEFADSYPDAYKTLRDVDKEEFDYICPDVGPEPKKMSHNWVVAPERMTTGKALLMGKPQLHVGNPNTMYEFHITGGRYNARGMTWAGVPACLVGLSDKIAWAPTALNSDCGDLFEERADPDNPDFYLFKGESKKFGKRVETIQVKDGEAITLEISETIHGPVVNDMVKGVEPGEIYAAQITFLNPETSTVGAMMGMMRAQDWDTFRAAMSEYYGPGAHIVYGDISGDIGYQALVKIPARRYRRTLPRQGWTGEDEIEMLPFELMPSAKNPKQNFFSTANGLPVGAWHPYTTCHGFGGGPRSWRLRELFKGDRVFSVEDIIEDIHKDSVTVAVRDYQRLMLAIFDEDGVPDELKERAEMLRNWGGKMLTDSPGFPLAWALLDVIQSSLGGGEWHLDKRLGYATGWSGFLQMFRAQTKELDENGKTPQEASARAWFSEALAEAWARPEVLNPPWTAEGIPLEMPYQDNGGWGSLAPEHDMDSPPMRAPSMPTIWSQPGECYVQLVDFSDLDKSMAFLPPGISERPDSPHYTDQVDIWANGQFRAAPISRDAVEAIRESSAALEYEG